ncbi:MAG: cytochrome d ubiquinol oxidase subunit II [Ilumatobacteraceae bacterium]
MSAAQAALAVTWIGVTLYALFGGADFGAGFWDLVAGGADRGRSPRRLIERVIAPVWEANHVWLIFVLVMLWTCFPPVFAAVASSLYQPLTLAAVGIILRGAGFAIRKTMHDLVEQRFFGAVFATSSVMTPYALGAVAGAVASGRVPLGNAQADPWTSWVNPTSVLGGVLAVGVCAYVAAVFLCHNAVVAGDDDLVDYFRRRATVTAVAVGVRASRDRGAPPRLLICSTA